MTLRLFKTVLLWILALQLLNMSIYSDAYWEYINGNLQSAYDNKGVDPTETIVEWLVEMKMGQQDMFTYSNHNTDSKNVVKVLNCHMDMHPQWQNQLIYPIKEKQVYFPGEKIKIPSRHFDILTPPPNS